MKYAQKEVQLTMFTMMDTDATLPPLLAKRADEATKGAILDETLQNQLYPYVQIGEHTSDPFRTHSRPGEELIQVVKIFSQDNDVGVIYTIADAVQALFGDISGTTFPSVTGQFLIASYFNGSARFRQEDKPGVSTTRLELRYRMLTQDTVAF